MEHELRLARFVRDLRYEAVPADAVRLVKRLLIAVSGTGVAGADEDGIAALRTLMRARGGTPEATTLVHGDRLPAASAALLNGAMCRALDYCDAMAPGPHIGSALIPAAFAAAELRGGCDGRTFIAALAAGAEIGSRMNLSEAQYDGYDPTGICVPFAAAAGAARVLDLDEHGVHHALALAFNRCGGSFQSHVDGSLGVRITQGWVAEAGVSCAQYAQLGLTGPKHFLSGHYGYRHLYGRDTLDPAEVTEALGDTWALHRVVFKKYPSCGVTQGATELTLGLVREHGLDAGAVASVEVRLPPYAHRLVGHPFRLGDNPRVDMQFSAQYCVANAIGRRASKLAHFERAASEDPVVRGLVDKVRVVPDAAMDARGHSSVDVAITTIDGRRLARGLDIAPGFPGNGLTDAEHLQRFADCIDYAPRKPRAEQTAAWLDAVAHLEAVDDVRPLLRHLIVEPAGAAA
jgi:2-methylcitrate dehydratase PrpD